MMWTEYDQATGRIRQSVSGPTMTPPAILVGVVGNNTTQYVAAGALATRPPTTVTAVQNGATVLLSNVAVGVLVYVAGDGAGTIIQDQTDGQVQLTLPASGSYIIDVEQFPELPFHLAVTVP